MSKETVKVDLNSLVDSFMANLEESIYMDPT